MSSLLSNNGLSISPPLNTFNICFAFATSLFESTVSLTKNIKSNLDSNAGGISTFSPIGSAASYLPYLGFAAAKIEHCASSVMLTPTLDIEMVCCSIASCMELVVCVSILSNSSI